MLCCKQNDQAETLDLLNFNTVVGLMDCEKGARTQSEKREAKNNKIH